MTARTPGPFYATEYDDTSGYDCMTGAVDVWSDSQRIATLDASDYGQDHNAGNGDIERLKSDAAFIVTACNQHDGLVAFVAPFAARDPQCICGVCVCCEARAALKGTR